MQTVNIHEAKTHLSRLVEQAAKDEPFVIAKAGKPMVKVMALNAPENELFFSAASLWEIDIKRGLGRDDFQVDARLLRRGCWTTAIASYPLAANML